MVKNIYKAQVANAAKQCYRFGLGGKSFVTVLFIFSSFFFLSCEKTERIYYEDGKTIKKEITIKNGKKNGKTTEYYNNGKIKGTYFYINDILNGKVTGYNINGNIEVETNYINGRQNGIRKEYYPSGKLASISNYIKGKREFEFVSFFENGDTSIFCNFENDKFEGRWVKYNKDKTIDKYLYYENDSIVFSRQYYGVGFQDLRAAKIEIVESNIRLEEKEIIVQLLGPKSKMSSINANLIYPSGKKIKFNGKMNNDVYRYKFIADEKGNYHLEGGSMYFFEDNTGYDITFEKSFVIN